MKKIIFSFIYLLSFNVGFCQKEIHQIENDSLRQFIEHFETITRPFVFSNYTSGEYIEPKLVQHFFDLDEEDTEERGVGYYYGYVYYEKEYLGIIYTKNYSPGAFGIDNYYINLVTLTYDGNLIDTKELGCFCNDSNLGSNDYHKSELIITIDIREVSIKEKTTHATLIEEDDTTGFKKIEENTYQVDIKSSGEID